MPKLSANQAKARFGELLARARQEPVTIEKHGRPVAVIISSEEYEQLQRMKLENLRAAVALGFKDFEEGNFVEVNEGRLQDLVDRVKAKGRQSNDE